eukprot:TRINITY_DN2_c0_g2_i1.p1 TRINITY_DN2_c0_g2~~TRINITY_DN2_c0_g2_i1.p1  ORF type:complete len:698 (+),score=62.09 TRINITY_DN2_c0_g2_i1:80-2173(+)
MHRRDGCIAALLCALASALGREYDSDRAPQAVVKLGHSMLPACSGCTTERAANGEVSYTRTYRGTTACSFMKVHFADFRLPPGALVRVCGRPRADGSRECYSYDDSGGMRTVDAGEDGVSRFAAMSIDGTLLTVSLVLMPGTIWGSSNSVTLDNIIEVLDTMHGADGGRRPQELSGCGTMDYRDAACYRSQLPEHYSTSMAVARVFVGLTGKVCSAWRVTRNNLVLTAEHCIGSLQILQSAEFHFNYQQSACLPFGQGESSAVIKVLGRLVLRADSEMDFSLVTLREQDYQRLRQWQGPNGERIGHMDFAEQEPAVGTSVYIPQFPLGQPKKIAVMEDTPSGFCEVQEMERRDGHHRMGYRCDTEGGSSGAPVVQSFDHKVVALHTHGGCQPDKVNNATNIGTKISHIRLSIAEYLAETKWPTGFPGESRLPSTRYPSTWFPTAAGPGSYPTGFPRTKFPLGPTEPTGFPSLWPGGLPLTGFPSRRPSGFPSGYPRTGFPRTGFPSSGFPSSGFPSSGFPSSGFPSSGFPSSSFPTSPPSGLPSGVPTTGMPTQAGATPVPVSGPPSSSPSGFPAGPSRTPSTPPTAVPSAPPRTPTGFPSRAPTPPTGFPSGFPTGFPSGWPSRWPTGWPVRPPTGAPSSTTVAPTRGPWAWILSLPPYAAVPWHPLTLFPRQTRPRATAQPSRVPRQQPPTLEPR